MPPCQAVPSPAVYCAFPDDLDGLRAFVRDFVVPPHGTVSAAFPPPPQLQTKFVPSCLPDGLPVDVEPAATVLYSYEYWYSATILYEYLLLH